MQVGGEGVDRSQCGGGVQQTEQERGLPEFGTQPPEPGARLMSAMACGLTRRAGVITFTNSLESDSLEISLRGQRTIPDRDSDSKLARLQKDAADSTDSTLCRAFPCGRKGPCALNHRACWRLEATTLPAPRRVNVFTGFPYDRMLIQCLDFHFLEFIDDPIGGIA